MKVINSFRGDYGFLSNFHICKIEYNGRKFMHSEGLFQSMKTYDEFYLDKMVLLSPSESKRFGRKVPLRSDWEEVKDECMYNTLVAKFTQNPDLAKKLLATGDALLIEGNTWNDRYWGVCRGKGENRLGILLMLVREDLQKGKIKVK